MDNQVDELYGAAEAFSGDMNHPAWGLRPAIQVDSLTDPGKASMFLLPLVIHSTQLESLSFPPL